MSMLSAAMDRSLNSEFVAVVIGEKQIIEKNRGLLSTFRHMTNLHPAEKKDVLKQIDLRGNVLGFCIELGIPELRKTIDQKTEGKHFQKRARITGSIGEEFRITLQHHYSGFLSQNGCTLNQITFQVDDNDVIEFLRKGGITFSRNTEVAHKVADCIAHANGKHWGIEGNVKNLHRDFRKDFHARVIKRIMR